MILIDAHVHIYDCFDLKSFLDSALMNFKVEAARHKKEHGFCAILLLSESINMNWFQRLADYADQEQFIGNENTGDWTFHRTKESCSLWAALDDGGQGFFVIAGRQIVTKENLEVLALVSDRKFKDGLPLQEVIQIVRENRAISVIPWGFGKWTGGRGRVLETALEEAKNSELFLGDNSGRPMFWPRPFYFKLAEKRGIRILPGSDPLPIASEFHRPGSFGFRMEASIDTQEPAKEIRRILSDYSTNLRSYGALEGPCRFFRNQLAMQIRKQLRKRGMLN